MGAVHSSLQDKPASSFLMHPATLTTAAIVIATAAYVFLRVLTKPSFKGTYSIEVDSNKKSAKNESVTRRHRSAPNEDLKVLSTDPGVKTLHDLLVATVSRRGNANAAGVRPLIKMVQEKTRVHGQEKTWEYPQLGAYEWFSYSEVSEMVDNIGSALASFGLQKTDHVGLFEETRLEWTVAAHATWRQGQSILTVYANLGEEALVYALDLGEVKAIVLNAKSLGLIVSVADQLKKLKYIIYTDEAEESKLADAKKAGLEVYSWAEAIALGKKNPSPARPPVADDLAMVMFTSGTTGMPKGVMLKHSQNIAAIAGAAEILVTSIGITADRDTYISYLPLAHILALIVHSALFYVGVPIGYGSPRSLTDSTVRECLGDLRELRPTLFVGVPTVYERIKAGIERKLRASPVAHKVFKTAFALKKFLKRFGLPTLLLDAIVFNKLKREVGGRVRAWVSGGAAISAPVIDFMETSFGIHLLQGYGLTETSGPSTVQELSDWRRGSVGAPLPSTRIKLVDVPDMNYLHTSNPPRGEIWIGGNNVSSGYYKNEEETNKAFIDGWFRTGDVGEWTPEGTLKIIDRIKNLVKPPHGEYIALESIESRYRNCQFVEHICAYVDSEHNEVVAVVQPNKLSLEAWAAKNGVDTSDYGDLCHDPKTNAAILKSLQETARQYKLKSIETVRAVHVTADLWTPDNDMLTAAQKLKRNNVIKEYREDIDKMYAKLGSD